MDNKCDKKIVANQDKPIRPRYGLPEVEAMDQPNEQNDTDSNLSHSLPIRIHKLPNIEEKNVSENEVASSYSEIPFASQYMEQEVSCQILTSKEVTHSNAYMNAELLENEPLDVDDEVDEDDNETLYNLDGNDHYFYTAQKSNSHANGPYGMTLMSRHLQQQKLQLPKIDPDVINDIEIDVQYLAASVDNLLENLCSLLHSISSITADNVEVHRNAVNRMTDSMDANIKCMYTIMAKTEEITKSMKPTEHLAQRIREIKRLVDMLESNM